MNILIVGFQRSGTTLLRRLLQLHPQVRRLYHEFFFFDKCKDKETLIHYVSQGGVDTNKHNWGEKCPYYPNIKGIPVYKYCEKWNKYFGGNSRILHVVRHPYDVVLSNVKKFKNIKTIDEPIELYKQSVSQTTVKLNKMKSVYTFKYEDLLINTDEMLFNIYKHCSLKPDIDYKKLMKKIQNPKYQEIIPSRAFAYKDKDINWSEYDMSDVLNELNKIDGILYET